MQVRLLSVFIWLPLWAASGPSATIIDSGSTNIAGMRITIDVAGRAMVEHRGGAKQQLKLPEKISDQLMVDLRAAGELSALPVSHCLKSVSFGSRLYIESGGVRTRDLSCPAQADPRAAALKKDAEEILGLVRGR